MSQIIQSHKSKDNVKNFGTAVFITGLTVSNKTSVDSDVNSLFLDMI